MAGFIVATDETPGAGYGEYGGRIIRPACNRWLKAIEGTTLATHCCGFMASDDYCAALDTYLGAEFGDDYSDWHRKKAAVIYDHYMTHSGRAPTPSEIVAKIKETPPPQNEQCPPGTYGKPPRCYQVKSDCAPLDIKCRILSTLGNIGSLIIIIGVVAGAVYVTPKIVEMIKSKTLVSRLRV